VKDLETQLARERANHAQQPAAPQNRMPDKPALELPLRIYNRNQERHYHTGPSFAFVHWIRRRQQEHLSASLPESASRNSRRTRKLANRPVQQFSQPPIS